MCKNVTDNNALNGGILPAYHYRMWIAYDPMPSFADLVVEFGWKNVSNIFDVREWDLHPSCVGMDETPGYRTFFVHDVGRHWKMEERIAWGLAQSDAVAPIGYRPTTHREFYAFLNAHPQSLNIAALGSSTLFERFRCVATYGSGGPCLLGHHSTDFGFYAFYRVLFVCK